MTALVHTTHLLRRIRSRFTKFTAALSSLCPSSGSSEEAKKISFPLNDRVPQKFPLAVTMMTRLSILGGPLPTRLRQVTYLNLKITYFDKLPSSAVAWACFDIISSLFDSFF